MLALTVPPARAGRIRTAPIYQQGAWVVQVAAFSPRALACVAQLHQGQATFSIWANGAPPVRLQFYAKTWHLGRGSTDLVMQIDKRPPWRLTHAQATANSVLFDLPANGAGKGVLRDIMQGHRLSLKTTAGAPLQHWSLKGSGAALRALIDCTKGLAGTNR